MWRVEKWIKIDEKNVHELFGGKKRKKHEKIKRCDWVTKEEMKENCAFYYELVHRQNSLGSS